MNSNIHDLSDISKYDITSLKSIRYSRRSVNINLELMSKRRKGYVEPFKGKYFSSSMLISNSRSTPKSMAARLERHRSGDLYHIIYSYMNAPFNMFNHSYDYRIFNSVDYDYDLGGILEVLSKGEIDDPIIYFKVVIVVDDPRVDIGIIMEG